MTIARLMTSNPVTVSAHDSLATAAERLWQADCGALPVVDDTGRPIAMITDRDICMATWSRDARPQDVRVADAMSHSLTTCRESDSVSTGEAAMRVAQVRRLPIVNGEGVLVGVLSLADVARAFGTQTASPLTSASDSIVTLARICDRPTASAA